MTVHRHPANIARYDHADRAGRLADRVTTLMGSWRFLGWQTALIGCWVAANGLAVALRWDPYPFVLLNLVFSVQAAYASPLILLAGNRSAEHDRARAEADHALLTAIHDRLSPAGGDDTERTAP